MDERQVYIVTSGEYSDYGIEGVFATRERAEEFLKQLSLWVTGQVEAWPLDSARPVDPFWFTGTITSQGDTMGFALCGNAPADGRNALVRRGPGYAATIQAGSAEHAAKIAKDMWAARRAEEESL